MEYNTIKTFDINGSRVLVRVDLNVPMTNALVSDNTRLTKIKSNLENILKLGGKPIVIGHIGRPNGSFDPNLSTKNILTALESVLKTKVEFCNDLIGPKAISATKLIEPGSVLLLENTRFHSGEEKNESQFSKELSKLGDLFCNDALSVCHRAHASTVGVTKFLPSFAGSHLLKEIETLEFYLSQPQGPLTAIVGGSKVSTKIELLKNLVTKVQNIIIGGGMANTFLLAKGYEVGKSICELELIPTAQDIIDRAKIFKCKVHLPIDLVTSKSLSKQNDLRYVNVDQCPSDHMIFDCGDKSIEHYSEVILNSKTLVWNGPLGVFEVEPFDNGTKRLGQIITSQTQLNKMKSIAGGGDTVAALNLFGFEDMITYVSTAGGAFLEWLEGKQLPGIEALKVYK